MNCSNCGTENLEGNKFCGKCGKPLYAPVSQPAPQRKPGQVYFWGFGVPTLVGLLIILCVICMCGSITVLLLPSSSSRTTAINNAPTSDFSKPSDTQRPAPTAITPSNYHVGDTISAGNWEYTVTKVEKNKTLVWSQFGSKVDAQGTFLIVYLTLKNIGTKNFGINTWDFKLVDSGSIEYSTSDQFGASSFVEYKGLKSIGGQCVPGLPVNTALVFDVNPTAKGFKLSLEQAQTIVDLGQ